MPKIIFRAKLFGFMMSGPLLYFITSYIVNINLCADKMRARSLYSLQSSILISSPEFDKGDAKIPWTKPWLNVTAILSYLLIEERIKRISICISTVLLAAVRFHPAMGSLPAPSNNAKVTAIFLGHAQRLDKSWTATSTFSYGQKGRTVRGGRFSPTGHFIP